MVGPIQRVKQICWYAQSYRETQVFRQVAFAQVVHDV